MIKTVDPTQVPASEFYKLLTDTVTPRPIAFVSSCDKDGNVNLSPFSFFNAFSANPPILVFAPLRRLRDNTEKHTLNNVKEHAEVVINLVSFAIVEQMSVTSCDFEKEVNEFKKAGLTELKSIKVKPPRVKEAAVSFECIVKQTIPLGDEGGAGTLVICEVIMAHFQENVLGADGRPDALKMDLVARLGEDWYSRISKGSLFKVAKPWAKISMGVDQIPEAIRKSEQLSGNDLGKLATIENLPAEEEVNAFLLEHPDLKNKSKEEIHLLAKEKIAADHVKKAWLILLNRI